MPLFKEEILSRAGREILQNIFLHEPQTPDAPSKVAYISHPAASPPASRLVQADDPFATLCAPAPSPPSRSSWRESRPVPRAEPPAPVETASSEPVLTAPRSHARTLETVLSPYHISQYFRSQGIVGEEANGNLLVVGIAAGKHMIVQGSSGSGKTLLVDAALRLFAEEEVYRLGLSSQQAAFYDAEQMNARSIVYVPELQKAMAGGKKNHVVIELFKTIAEGRDASRSVTNASRDGVETFTITKNKTIVGTIAHENDFMYDRETQRRFIILETDDSLEQVARVTREKMRRRLTVDLSDEESERADTLSARVAYVRELQDVHVLNPFLPYLETLVPRAKKAHAYLDHFLDLYTAWGTFFSPERESFRVGKRSFVLLDMQDAYTVFSLYNAQFCSTLSSFNDGAEYEAVPDWAACYHSAVRTAREDLVVRLPEESLHVATAFPEVIDRWVHRQSQDGVVSVAHYRTGESLPIADVSPKRPSVALMRPYRILDPSRLLPGVSACGMPP